MMESYKDCNNFFDTAYKDRVISLELLFKRKYKEIVASQKLSNYRIDRITKIEFDQLITMNIFKLNNIITNNWKFMNYEDFITRSYQNNILEAEYDYILKKNAIPVLNSSLFFIIDFFGEEYYNTLL